MSEDAQKKAQIVKNWFIECDKDGVYLKIFLNEEQLPQEELEREYDLHMIHDEMVRRMRERDLASDGGSYGFWPEPPTQKEVLSMLFSFEVEQEQQLRAIIPNLGFLPTEREIEPGTIPQNQE